MESPPGENGYGTTGTGIRRRRRGDLRGEGLSGVTVDAMNERWVPAHWCGPASRALGHSPRAQLEQQTSRAAYMVVDDEVSGWRDRRVADAFRPQGGQPKAPQPSALVSGARPAVKAASVHRRHLFQRQMAIIGPSSTRSPRASPCRLHHSAGA